MKSHDEMIEDAARCLLAAQKQRGETTVGMRRNDAANIGRACGLTIQSPGSESAPNPTVEAIIAKARELGSQKAAQ